MTVAATVAKVAPLFPWFGSKKDVAAEIWARFGDEDNRHRECIWYSPHCLRARQPSLFEVRP